MAYVGVGETSALGYLPNDGHVFLNVYARLKKSHKPELHIKTAHPHYLIQRFIDANTFKYERHIDNCFKVPKSYAKEFLGFVRPINEQLEELDKKVKRLDKTVSEDVDVADLHAFHLHLGKCHNLIDDVGDIEHRASYFKLILEALTEKNKGIPKISAWKEHKKTSFSQPLARAFPEHRDCLRTKVTGYLDLNHKAPKQPGHVIDFERDYSVAELRAHYHSYVELLAQQKRIEDLLAVEKKHLKVAIGTSQSFPHLYSWSRREVTEVDPIAFRTKHKNRYEASLATTTKMKCEILPFRG